MIRDVDYEDFSKRLEGLKQRKPLYGTMELTYKCNYDCIHCYAKGQAEDEKEPSFWKDVISQARDLGGIEITFSGGEPLLYPGFKEVYLYAKTNGFLIHLFTAGWALDKEMSDFLKEHPPLNIEITLNSLERDNYARITRAKGAFDTVMRNILRIKAAGLPLVLKANGLKENKDEILKIKEFAENLLGEGKFKFDSFIFPALNKDAGPSKHRLSAEEIIAIEKSDSQMLKQRRDQLKHNDELFNPSGLYHCNSCMMNYFINPQGLLQFCHLSKKYSTDLTKEKFNAGFERFLGIFREKYKTKSRCIDCLYRKECYQCPARAYLEQADEESPVEYYCQLARATQNFFEELKQDGVRSQV